MDRKALAILLIGIIFGIEGVGLGFLGMIGSTEITQDIQTIEDYSGVLGYSEMEIEAEIAYLNFLNLMLTIMIIYGAIKTIIAVFCIAVGASELLEKKAEKTEKVAEKKKTEKKKK